MAARLRITDTACCAVREQHTQTVGDKRIESVVARDASRVAHDLLAGLHAGIGDRLLVEVRVRVAELGQAQLQLEKPAEEGRVRELEAGARSLPGFQEPPGPAYTALGAVSKARPAVVRPSQTRGPDR